jgi:hypothetical protein
MVVTAYKNGLKQELRKFLNSQVPFDAPLREVIHRACRIGTEQEAATWSVPAEPAPMDFSALAKPAQQSQVKGNCRNCGKKGHWAAQCRLPKKAVATIDASPKQEEKAENANQQ